MPSYTVRKPFRFAGRSYDRGSKFTPGQVACPTRKVRQLVDQRILVSPLDELTLVKLTYGVNEPEVSATEIAPENMIQEPLPRYQGKQADKVATNLIVAIENGDLFDMAEYARLPKRCQKLVDDARSA